MGGEIIVQFAKSCTYLKNGTIYTTQDKLIKFQTDDTVFYQMDCTLLYKSSSRMVATDSTLSLVQVQNNCQGTITNYQKNTAIEFMDAETITTVGATTQILEILPNAGNPNAPSTWEPRTVWGGEKIIFGSGKIITMGLLELTYVTPGEVILQGGARKITVEVKKYSPDVGIHYDAGTELKMTMGVTMEVLKSVDLEFLVDFIATFGGRNRNLAEDKQKDKLFWKVGEKISISAGEIVNFPPGANFRFKDNTYVEYKGAAAGIEVKKT
jgi:hypothetical protein